MGKVTTPANKLTGIYGVSPTDCSPNPVLKLHNYIFQVKKHENHENQHLPLCSFVIVINYRTPRTIKFVVDMNYGCIPPMNWWGLACTILTILGYTIPLEPELFETHEKIGWILYVLIFFYTYTIFSIFLTTYIWLLVNVFGFRVTGTILGIWVM